MMQYSFTRNVFSTATTPTKTLRHFSISWKHRVKKASEKTSEKDCREEDLVSSRHPQDEFSSVHVFLLIFFRKLDDILYLALPLEILLFILKSCSEVLLGWKDIGATPRDSRGKMIEEEDDDEGYDDRPKNMMQEEEA